MVRGRISAYMTVEASLIMSVVLMLYLFIIQSFFWVYDRCILEQDMAVFTIKCAGKENQETLDTWQQMIQSWDTEQYLWMTLQEPVLRKNGETLEITGLGSSAQMGDFQIVYKVKQLNAQEWLRLKRRLSKTIEKEGEAEE